MTVYEFLNLFVEEDKQKFAIYENDRGENVFEGFLKDLPPELAEKEITSIDNIINSLVINV